MPLAVACDSDRTNQDSRCLQAWLGAIWFVVIVPLYLLVLLSMINPKSQLKDPCFKFFVSLGVADLVNICVSFLLYRQSWVYGWWPMSVFKMGGVPLIRLYFVLFGFSFMSQRLGCLIVAVNRFTALIAPLQYTWIWTATLISCCVAAQWLLSLIVVLPFMFVSFEMYENPESNGTKASIEFRWSDKKQLSTAVVVSRSVEALVMGAIVLLYAAQFVRIVMDARRKVQPFEQDYDAVVKRRASVRLSVCCFLFTTPLIVWCLSSLGDVRLTTALYSPYGIAFGQSAHFFAVDFCVGFKCCILLLFSSQVRRAVGQICVGAKENRPVPAAQYHRETRVRNGSVWTVERVSVGVGS